MALGLLVILSLRVMFRLYKLKKLGYDHKINWFWFWTVFIAFYAKLAVIVLLYRFIAWCLG